MTSEKCANCDGNGFVIREYTVAVPVCCNRPTRGGECCGNPDPYPELRYEQEPCPCGGENE